MNEACCICSTPWAVDKLHRVDLTDKEQAVIRATGGTATSFVYCPPCWAMMKDRTQGAAFLAGVLEVGLRQAGDGAAQEKAQRFREFLLQASGRSVSRKA